MPIPIRVLIVEDTPADAELILGNLADHGFAPQAERVETEAAYLAGLDAAPDVILADYRLPHFSGPRALELLNERRLDIPFIVASGSIGDVEAANLIKAGASDFLLKDRMARLGPAVTRALELKRGRDEKHQMEVALVKSEQRFRTLSENSSDLMIVIDHRDMITYISPSLKRIMEHEVGDALDKNFLGFIHREDVSAATTNLASVVQNPDVLRVVELRCRHKNGNWLTFETILRNAFAEPAIDGIVVNARDITERKNQERKIVRLSRIRAVMSAINSLIVRVRNRQELFNGACRIAIEQGGFGIAWIGVLNQETLEITPAACAGVDAESSLAQSPNTARPDTPIGQGVLGSAIREQRAVSSNDITTEPGVGGEHRKEATRRGYRSSMSLPLLMEGAAVGNFSLFAKEANFFTADEMKLLTELAGDISFALEHISKQEKLDKLSRIRAVSSEINAAIVRIRGRESLLKETCRIAAEQGKFELVWIASLDPEKQQVRPVAWIGFSAEAARSVSWATIKSARGTLAEAIQTRRTAVRNDIDPGLQGGVLRQEAISKGCLSTVCMPFVVDDRVAGLCVLFAPGQGFFDPDELALLDELAADVSFALEYIAKEEKLNYLAYYDALTGLPNRVLFDDRMAQSLRAASHENSKTALVLIDLERFRVINDTLGRHVADGLLKLVAERLQSVIFDRDSLARVHADVFAGLFSDIRDEPDIARIVEEKIICCLSQSCTIAGQELRVAAKIGVAIFPSDATEPDALFSSAEAALRQAKRSGERYLFYAPKMNAMVAERLKLENKLQRALERDEFVLFYQPKVDLGTGRVAGLEALIRWNDPDAGLVMPMLFIPLLEETGMIVEVGAWAMKRAVSQHAAWQAAGLQPPPIAVNVSAVQLKRKDFVTSVQQAIAIAGEPEHGLDLEITESMIMEDIEASIEKLKSVRELGVGISIDDFGTGHSSLRYLTRLPVTALKVDRAFIRHMNTDPDDMAIVSTIITLGRTLNLKVIAEGVETEEQRKFLQLLKCDQFQGYLFSKPVPAEQVPALLAR